MNNEINQKIIPKYSNIADFDYFLPDELIAQFPLKKRDMAKMMVLSKSRKTIQDKVFTDFLDFVNKDDILVLNNTKVIPARLLGHKETGAAIEIFLLRPAKNFNQNFDGMCKDDFLYDEKNAENNTKNRSKTLWYALIKNLKRLKVNDIVKISDELYIKLLQKAGAQSESTCENLVELIYKGDTLDNVLEKYGDVPLPPYIQRKNVENDKENYQTVFAKVSGSVAAPTAGLHFTSKNLDMIRKKGVRIAYITLNVGLGTFLPVKTENILEHKMHTESFEISNEASEIINSVFSFENKTKKGNIVAVGTTVTRTLEAVYQKYGKILPVKDETDIFIYPPYEFKVVDKLLTNFHLPKSTLIMLVSAFADREYILKAYNHAVLNNYRFFSYGDCMFIDK